MVSGEAELACVEEVVLREADPSLSLRVRRSAPSLSCLLTMKIRALKVAGEMV